MPRKPAARVAEKPEEDEVDGATERFLDGLPDGDDDPDEDEDNDDSDEGDGDDSGEGEALPAAASALPPPRRRGPAKEAVLNVPAVPRGIRGPRSMTPEQRAASPALNKAREFQENAYQEIDTLLAKLNFKTRQYEVRVGRLEPEVDENGVMCTGLLYTYRQHVSVDQIQQRFGGGVYELKVCGPHPTTGRVGIIKTETFTIAGHPKPMPSHKDDRGKQTNSETSEVLRAITESNERNQQRVMELMERNREGPSAISEILPVLTPILEKLFTKNDESTKALLELQREERKAEERRREDERKDAEERRREERDERRREEDKRRAEDAKAEDRRREDERRAEEARKEERKADERRREEQVREERERRKEELDQERERMKADAAEKQRQHERDMAAQAERTKQDAQRTQEYLSMLTNFQNAQMEMMNNRQETGGTKAVVENLMMLKNLSGALTGSDQEPSNFDKFTEGFQNVVQTVMPVAQQLIAARRPVALPAVQQQQAAPPRPIVVDLGPRLTALPATPTQPQPIPNPGTNQGTNPSTAPSVVPPEPTGDESQAVVNDLMEFQMPSDGDDMTVMGPLLLKNVDLAVQRNLTPEQIVESILDPFEEAAPLMMAMVRGWNSDQLIEFVEQNVPNNWAIVSPKGEEIIGAAHEMWRDEEDEQ